MPEYDETMEVFTLLFAFLEGAYHLTRKNKYLVVECVLLSRPNSRE